MAIRQEVGLWPCFGVAKRQFRLRFDVSGHGVAPETGIRISIRKNAGCYWTTSERKRQKTPQAQGFTGFLGHLRIAPDYLLVPKRGPEPSPHDHQDLKSASTNSAIWEGRI